MLNIKHILFPFDFSEAGSRAAPFVCSIASHYDSKVSVLTVLAPFWEIPPGQHAPLAGFSGTERDLRTLLDQTIASEFSGLCVNCRTELGDPALKIIEFARSQKVDLIMMPTHGVSGDRSMLFRSVTAAVLEAVSCPLWAVTHEVEQQSQPRPRSILCALKDNSRAIALMRWASEFSQRMGAGLRFIHVVSPVTDTALGSSVSEIEEDICGMVNLKLAEAQRSAGIEGPLRVTVGTIAETIAAEAREAQADVILIGRRHVSSPTGREGNACAIIQSSPCPVLSV